MEKYILNETPLRTSNNFGINNIEVLLDIPKCKEFENFNLYTENIDKIDVEIISNKNEKEKNKIGLERKVNYIVKITVPKNIEIKEKIVLEFDLDDDNEFLMENIDIILEENSEASFEILYNSYSISNAIHSGLLKMHLKKGSKANVIVSNLIIYMKFKMN